ncbi:MAG: hypothetical protein P9X22_07545 [Candidatus Zapsychrus exili]|nr:hypothetical protein [Candidatus Zapsychrus exili]
MKIKSLNFILFFSLVIFSCVSIFATPKYSDRTFMTYRHMDANMPMEYSTWHNQIYLKLDKTKLWGANLQVVGFYNKSDNQAPTGRYFGHLVEQDNDYRDFIKVDNKTAANTTVGDIPAEFIFHNYDDFADHQIADKIKFGPEQTTYDASFYYYQNLDKFLNKLYFKAKLPIVGVKDNFNPKSVGVNTKATRDSQTVSLYDVLTGNFAESTTDSENLQEKLNYAKINVSKTKTGVADIDLTLGYDLLRDKYRHFGVNIGFIIPTSNKPKGEYLFEPIYGNAGHWAIRAGLDSKMNLYKEGNWKLDLLMVGDFKYFFRDNEKRTLSLKLGKSNFVDEAHDPSFLPYYLVGQQSDDANKALFPLANISTRDIRVTPGAIFEAMADLAFSYKSFVIDLGYNLYVRGRESVSLRGSWTDNAYAIAAPGFDTTNAFTNLDDVGTAVATINTGDLDFDSVRTPTQITNKAFLALGYGFNKCKYPVMLGAGTSYEYSARNSALSNYAFWGKLGVSF